MRSSNGSHENRYAGIIASCESGFGCVQMNVAVVDGQGASPMTSEALRQPDGIILLVLPGSRPSLGLLLKQMSPSAQRTRNNPTARSLTSLSRALVGVIARLGGVEESVL